MSDEKERWKIIKEWPNYEVSDLGRVRIKKSKVIKKPFYNHFGYLRVTLFNGKKKKNLRVHRLVAFAFVSGFKPGWHVDHINHVCDDNRAVNLRWMEPDKNRIKTKSYKERKKWMN